MANLLSTSVLSSESDAALHARGNQIKAEHAPCASQYMRHSRPGWKENMSHALTGK